MASIVLIGSGNVATHLGKALAGVGHNIVQVISRNAENATALANELNAVASTSLVDALPAYLYLIAVNDDSIRTIVQALNAPGRKVAHTSGSIPLSVYDGTLLEGGIFYPLQTFSKLRSVNINTVPFCIEAQDTVFQDELLRLADELSESVQIVDSTARKRLHVAAVFASNFRNHLYHISETLLKEHDLSLDMLRPLILEVAQKAQSVSPAQAQTGPAMRKDTGVMEEHVQALQSTPNWQKIYTLLSESIQATNDENKL